MSRHSPPTVSQATELSWDDEEIQRVADILKAISHPLRLSIVCLLADGELSVNEICRAIGTSQPNVSQHLTQLSNNRLLLSRKQANKVYYSLFDQRLKAIIGLLRETYCP
jgi:ArsR family transcriptional regulator